MKIVKIQEKELNEARELQKKCVDLHLPVPPVVLWKATITDKNGIEREQTIAKANSYVRNALNLLSRFVGMTSPSIFSISNFKDGLINLKNTNGIMNAIDYLQNGNTINFGIGLGDNPSPPSESLDYYQSMSQTGQWTSAGSLHYSNFDENNRKLITQFIIVLVNSSATATQSITEAGVFLHHSSSSYLMLRDIFAPIAVGPGESIRFVYQTEVLYPL